MWDGTPLSHGIHRPHRRSGYREGALSFLLQEKEGEIDSDGLPQKESVERISFSRWKEAKEKLSFVCVCPYTRASWFLVSL